jgi:hypothetical protein
MDKVRISGVVVAIGVFAGALALAFVTKAFGLPNVLRLGVLTLSFIGVLVFLQAIGMGVKSLIVDDFNRMNLQSLITFAWFVVLSAAFVSGSFINMTLWNGQPRTTVGMFLDIPTAIWLLAGVVLTGVVGNGVTDTVHANRAPASRTGESAIAETPRRVNAMYRNVSPSEASPGDLVTYRQYGVQNTPDMGSVQQLLLQTTTLVGYAAATGYVFVSSVDATNVLSLPALPDQLLALLGVSTAAQIGNRAVPRDKSPPPPATGGPAAAIVAAGGVVSGGVGEAAVLAALSSGLQALYNEDKAVGAAAVTHAASAQKAASSFYRAECPSNDNSDAFTVAYWSALMAEDGKIGPERAVAWATVAIEAGTPSSIIRSIQAHNATIGRRRPTSDGKLIVAAVTGGECRVDRGGIQPSDARFLI